ncbi:hypothetical protein M758_7G010600 [Ceratodon purpureus]|uniref:tRNA-5-taurinomethyluridine 2-sulfurtransferase n=1 Tax=Ceratodon purpureus TaxID=3225 RepID=A0A8T0H5R3_CERPU|nr:hypothetical protein KC19_7G010500 [Ceratodon purpureus]KAG0609746.1 hypothetical protein M758_7G010600 [Ceratodon purpureus]
MAMAMVSLPTRQPLVLPIAASTSYPRLNSQQFSSLRNQCGLSLDERCVRGGGSQRLVAVRASVGEAGLSVASGDVDAASGDAKFERVIGVLGRSRALDALDERVAQVDGNSGASVAVDWQRNERALECCEVGQKLNVAVLLSGGVDSSVGLRLLCAAGHSCTAFYLKIWFQEDFENFWSECPWEDDLRNAQAVCNEVGVELRVVHFTDEYWNLVVSHSVSEIQAGRTPNPDILCNTCVKFGAFLDHIKDAGFDRVASGHYARVRKIFNSDNGKEERTELLLCPDEMKDQTYFLSQLRQEQLSRLIFPLGCLMKTEVRQLAEVMGLFNKNRKDSQGICFLGKVKFSEFTAKHLGEREGRLLEAETGELLGLHKGFWFYTMGQRQGLRLSNGPWFVVAKDIVNNVVFISREYYSEDKRRRAFRVGSFNWFSGTPPSDTSSLQCKVRHGAKLYTCSMELETDWMDFEINRDSKPSTSAVVNLNEDDQGLAPGQYAAFYQDGVCLGSAVIIETLGGVDNSNVSTKALEIAQQPFDVEVYKNSRPKISNSLRVPKILIS